MASASKKSFIFMLVVLLCAAGGWWVYNHGNPFDSSDSEKQSGANSSSSGNVPASVTPNPVTDARNTTREPVQPVENQSGRQTPDNAGVGVQPVENAADNPDGQGDIPPTPQDGVGTVETTPDNSNTPETGQALETTGEVQGGENNSEPTPAPEPSGNSGSDEGGAATSVPADGGPVQGAGSSAKPQDEGINSGRSVLFNEAAPVKEGDNLVRGEVDPGTVSLDTQKLIEESAIDGRGPEDGVIGVGFINNLARFMVDNYWPAGTHPSARGRGVVTADVKLANVKYGSQLEGFSVGRSIPDMGRQRVLQYALKPSMVKGLYGLYNDRFISALGREAATRKRTFGGEERVLTLAETAQMFKLYSQQSRAYAGIVRSYLSDAENPGRVLTYIKTEHLADEAYQRYHLAIEEGRDERAFAREYQVAVVNREQARKNVAAALRRGGNTGGLDTETLVFVAMWLNRRPVNDAAALDALVGVLEDCAARMDEESARLGR